MTVEAAEKVHPSEMCWTEHPDSEKHAPDAEIGSKRNARYCLLRTHEPDVDHEWSELTGVIIDPDDEKD